MSETLSRESEQKIDGLVQRVAQKAGYNNAGNMTYKEHLQAKLKQEQQKASQKYRKYRHKFSLRTSNADFAEEIRTYLRDGLVDLIREGHSEEEALKITMDQFEEAELNESFDDFMKEFNSFGMEKWMENWDWKTEEVIGLFYGGFLFLGLAAGGLIGFLKSGGIAGFHPDGWIYTLIGLGVGVFVGLGCGMIANAVYSATRRK